MLSAALAGSVALNYWQHRRAITAPLRADLAAAKDALDDSAALQASTRESADRLLDAAEAVTQQLGTAGMQYRRAVRDRPITDPQCAPGQARVDAVNHALGAPPSE